MTDIPTTQENIDAALAFLESNLAQTSPLLDKAFLQVLAALQGMTKTELYQYGIERVLQVLALTATGEDLDDIAKNYGLTRKAAVTAILNVAVTGTPGETIPITTTWIGRPNNLRYFQETSALIPAGAATFKVYCEFAGISGNLQVNDAMDIGGTLENVSPFARVYAIDTVGSNKETDDELRIRVLDEIQTVGGGSNSADIRTWGQEAANVLKVYPYTGSPPFASSTPGERTVYVETTTAFDPDGIPDAGVLAAVRTSITTDPDTGKSRQALGSTDDTLGVLAITRTEFFFTVGGVTVDPSVQAEAEADVETALDEYARSLRPWIDGLDPATTKSNVITSVSASEVVQDVMKKYGGYTQSVNFGIILGTFLLEYELNPGQLAKATVNFV
jgi:uncharacterized phage protein gp47/JayE